MPKKLFSSENQPQKRGSQWFKTKIVDSLKRQGMSEEAFLDLLIQKALSDGGVFITELLKRYSPVPKQAHDPIEIDFAENATPAQKANAVVDAIAAGEISPDVGHMFIDAISKSLAIEEVTELAKRLEALEKILNAQKAD